MNRLLFENASLLVVDGNPLADLEVLAEPARHLDLAVKDGRVARARE